jgi:stage II sporulation protein AB (anti-sigma F factor)
MFRIVETVTKPGPILAMATTLHATADARQDCVRPLRDVAATVARDLGLSDMQVSVVKLCVSEAVTNAIVHAYPEKIGLIKIVVHLFEGGADIIVKDSGKGIEDVKKAMEPLFTTGGEDRSGLGFTVMESLMDKLKVVSKVGKGTTVRMRKLIPPRPLKRV